MLKRSSITETTTATSKSKSAPPVQVFGRVALAYAKAAAAEKAAKLEKEVAAAALKEIALPIYFRQTDTGGSAIEVPSSVKVQDETESIVNVAFKSVYSAVAPEVAEGLFAGLVKRDGSVANVNNYVHDVPKVSFDTAAFSAADGSFLEDKFQAFKKACDAVAVKLGIANPLAISNVVVPKESFHRDRFIDFTAVQQAAICAALPNTVALSVSALVEAPAPEPTRRRRATFIESRSE